METDWVVERFSPSPVLLTVSIILLLVTCSSIEGMGEKKVSLSFTEILSSNLNFTFEMRLKTCNMLLIVRSH